MSLLMFGSRGFDTTTISGANLGVWLRPDGITTDGTYVVTWRNDGLLGGSFTQTIDTNKRFRYASTANPNGGPAARGNATNNSYMVMDSSGLGFFNGKTGGTSFAVWKTTGSQTQAAFYSDTGAGLSTNRFTHHRQSDSSGNGSITMRCPDNVVDGAGERTYSSGSGIFTDDVYGIDTIRHDVGGNHFSAFFGGRIVGDGPVWQFAAPSTFPATNSTRISIGATGATGQYDQLQGNSYLVELLVFNRPLAYSEKRIVWDYLHGKYPTIARNYGAQTDIIIFDGDSIMQSLTRTKDSVPYLAVTAMSSPSLIYWRNDAISGTNIQTAESDITGVKGILSGTYPSHLSLRNALYDVSIGTNNVSSGSESASTAFSRLTSLFGTLTTNNISVNASGAGFNRLVTTQIPRTDNATTTNVFAFNTEMTNRMPELAAVGVEGIVDPTQLSPFDGSPDGATDVADTTYYNADKIHPNATGDALIAPLHKAQLEALRQRRRIETSYGSYIKGWYRSIRVDANSSIGTMYNLATNGSSYDATQSTSTRKATYTARSRYGYPGVTFSGAASPNNTRLSLASGGLDQINGASTVLAVFCFKVASATPAANETIYMASINPSNSTVRLAIQHTTGNKIVMAARAGDFGSAATLTSTTSIGTGICVVSCLFDMANTDAYVWLNGTADGSNTSFNNGGGTAIASNNAGHISFGSLGSESNPGAFTLYEFLLLKDPPNPTAARDDIETMLGNTYTVTVA